MGRVMRVPDNLQEPKMSYPGKRLLSESLSLPASCNVQDWAMANTSLIENMT